MIGTNDKRIMMWYPTNGSGWMVFLRKNGDYQIINKHHGRNWIESEQLINRESYLVGKASP